MSLHGSLHGKVALVTGAGQGIGFAIAQALGREGVRIVVNDLGADVAARAVQELRSNNVEAEPAPGNVAVADGVTQVFEVVQHAFGALDVLVNNAGMLRPTALESTSEEEWDLVIAANLKSTYLCSRAAISALRRSTAGRIVNISSSAGKSVSTLGGPHYTAAKAGVLGLTRHLARELARDRITVNAVCPGLIDTAMVRASIEADRIAAYARGFPVPRLGQPEEVAELVTFLASERAAYITGASIDINGGDLTI